MKIKLPRKRKKACIKSIGKADYLGCSILSEILLERAITDKQKNKAIKFPHYRVINGKIILQKNW